MTVEKNYPTSKQKKYLNDLIEIITNQLTYINEEYLDILDNDTFNKTDKFYSMNTNEEIGHLILYLNMVSCPLSMICKSIKNKDIEGFKHLITPKEFLKFHDRVLKNSYEKLYPYIELPIYEDLKEHILMNIKQ